MSDLERTLLMTDASMIERRLQDHPWHSHSESGMQLMEDAADIIRRLRKRLEQTPTIAASHG